MMVHRTFGTRRDLNGLRQIEPPSAAVLQRMSNTPQRDNLTEMSVRSALHRAGFRFRLHQKIVPGTKRTVDIVLPRYRIAVFVNGCFWHGCPRHATWPKKNSEFWRQKIEANRARDADTDRRLRMNGWNVIRIWEHQEPGEAVTAVNATLGRDAPGRRTRSQNPSRDARSSKGRR